MKTFLHLILLTGLAFASPQAKSQGIYNSATWVVVGNATLVIQDGGFHNNGGLFQPATGTIILTGSAAPSVSAIGGTNPMNLYNLNIVKPANGAQLGGDLVVDGTLTMLFGNLDLNQHQIDLGSGAGTIANENNNSRITGTTGGTIRKTALLNAPVAANPGNLGVEITSNASLGNTVVIRGHAQQTSAGGGLSINRYFDLTPENDAGLDATLKMYYFENELAGIAKSELNFFKSVDAGTSWTFVGMDNSDPINNWVSKNGIPQLSRWTLASNITNPLPLQLLSFTARLAGTHTDLQWVTSQEVNISFFDVERSVDGIVFQSLFTVPDNAANTLTNTYNAVDPDPVTGTNYYRLKEVDLDGKSAYSPVATVFLAAANSCVVYPNPAKDHFYQSITAVIGQKDLVQLMDNAGHVVRQQIEYLQPGSNNFFWNIAGLPGGIYTLYSQAHLSPPIRIFVVH